ncbi:MAG TPA: aminopeptidase P N-terminal domain-containing protein, partial [Chitinophagaceae bacterium]|nr:aminopeptidase P N-terminal domain-containing protein [Chitinophagaceae bacterium]
MKYAPLPAELFRNNRKRFVDLMVPDSIAIFNSNDEVPSNGDTLYRFRQNSDLLWLTGIEQEDSMLILYPGNPDPRYREVLVLVRPNELKEKWDGRRLRSEDGERISGIPTVVWLDSLEPLLRIWMHDVEKVYLNSNENDRRGGFYPSRDFRFCEKMKKEYPLHGYLRAARILKELRPVKTKWEIGVISKAIDITGSAFRRLLRYIRPGVMENGIEAEIVHEFLSQGATGEAYPSILASGDRARTLHYIANSGQCLDGELVLMDFGAQYGIFNADLTRTVPVNGKFTKRQREVYQACLHLHRYAASILKPGPTVNEYETSVYAEAEKTFIKIGLLSRSEVKNQDPENPAYRQYLYHGISHHLGIDV